MTDLTPEAAEAAEQEAYACLEAEDRPAQAFWDQMRADGVPVAKLAEPDLEPEAEL